jgi:cellobiose phosphorylase
MGMETNGLTRRTFLAGAGALAASPLVLRALQGSESLSMGAWFDDALGLPGYRYTGPLRVPENAEQTHGDSEWRKAAENRALLPDDPVFLLGNYRLTLFAHASGRYQIVTAERAWGRLNDGDHPWTGANEATVEFAGQKHALIGLDAPAAESAEKCFGVGFARYRYDLSSGVKAVRKLSVLPSTKPGDGTSAFLVQVSLSNTSEAPVEVRYTETTRARYRQLFAEWATEQHDVEYAPREARRMGSQTVAVDFNVHPRHRMAFPPAGQMSCLEQFPPSLFVQSRSTELQPYSGQDGSGHSSIGVSGKMVLSPGEEKVFSFVVGYTRDASAGSIDALTGRLNVGGSKALDLASAYREGWLKAVPHFAAEADKSLRREMRWNAAVMEQMACWREYYDETIQPEGTVYEYIWGVVASSRDQAQHALPLCHTNPALARSTLRYILKRTLPDGEVKLNDQGFGWVPSGAQQTSDQQLFFFLLLAEYLRVTGDASILTESIEYYPRNCAGKDTGLAHVRQAFVFVRDRVGVGAHGIMRRWNSDWNDMFFFWPTTKPYARLFDSGESLMNSGMAIVILGDLSKQIERLGIPDAQELVAAMREYRTDQYGAWLRDLGDRAFPRRAWEDYKTSLGDDNMWLEPQGFALLIPEFPVERKKRLYGELERRLLDGEPMGARQIENPVDQPGTPMGTRENGGFWYALNGPMILGLASFDRDAAEKLLRKMTFANYAKNYPAYWTGQWSASDALDSARLKSSGLSSNIVYCSHAHAWPLYCYLRLREKTS